MICYFLVDLRFRNFVLVFFHFVVPKGWSETITTCTHYTNLGAGSCTEIATAHTRFVSQHGRRPKPNVIKGKFP